MASTEAVTPDQRGSVEVLKSLVRHFNCLNEDTKNKRKMALEAIKKETIDKGLSSGVLQEVFSGLLKSLLKCLSDPMERCRETAIRMLGEFIRCVPRPEESLPYIIPCLAQRLGREEAVEPAEELRLSIMQVLTLTVEVCGRHLVPYLNDMINILQRTIVDPFPDVKRESCKCTVSFAKCVPEHFHTQADSLAKPLMQTISHQRSTVRVSVIEATGTVIQYGPAKSLDDVLPRLAERLLDDSPQVRKAVTVVVGDWLLHMGERYSYFNKLLPLLLCSLNDEIPEIRLLAADLWRQTGAQWEKENEDSIKNKMDFLLSPPPLYPVGVERPGLGCRELVVRNMSWMVAGITRDMTDWLVGPQIKASQLLSVVLLHAEDRCTEHLQRLLTTLYQACSHTEKEVAANCLEAAKLLGTFVPPEAFLKLLLEQLEHNSFSCTWAPLAVLAAVLGGCSGPLLRPHLQQIAETLSQPNVCQVYQRVEHLKQLLSCVDALLCQCGPDCGPVSLQLLQVLVTVQSLSTEPLLSDKALESVRCLCKVQNLASVPELYRCHMDRLLTWLAGTVSNWSSYSPQRLQLQVIATQSGPVIGEFVPQLMPLLRSCLHPDRDPEMRLAIFAMLAKLLLDGANTLDSHKCFNAEAEAFLDETLLPNLVWRGGRTLGAIRTAALSCLLALLHGGAITPTQLLCVEDKLTPQVLSALEEDSHMARLFACRSLYTMLRLIGPGLHPETLNKIYPEVLKRLDDSNEEVRAMALRTLDVWLSSLTKEYNPQHLELLFQQLLLHLDDPRTTVQEQVLEVLKKGSLVCPALMKREVEVVADKHRSRFYCDQLLQHINNHISTCTSSFGEYKV